MFSSEKIFSFDIFDTLLFRLARRPEDVFLYMYEKEPKLFPTHIGGEDWKRLRMCVYGQARKRSLEHTGNSEVTLEEIYQFLPAMFEHKKELMELEIECEAELCYLNDTIYSQILELHNAGMKIILTSDMYMNSDRIEYILRKNGFKTELVDRIFVSCEYRASKADGNLYDVIIKHYNVSPQEIVHIGDNYVNDIGMAKNKGIKTYSYSVVSGAEFNYPYLMLEKYRFDDTDSLTYTLRLSATEKGLEYNEEEKFWYDTGAMILGPFLAGYAEWVLDFAEQKGIKRIRSMMREGKFLTKILNNAAKYRNTEFDIQNLYISRLALLRSKTDMITEEDIQYFVRTHGIKLKDVFDVFGIVNPYSDCGDIKTSELNNIEELEEYLASEAVIKEIKANSEYNCSNTIEYFKEMGLFESSITVDVGWRGSIQNLMGELLSCKHISSDIHNLLIFSSAGSAMNVMNGNNIYGYIGNFGKENTDIELIYPRLMELFLGCEDGTTVGYEKQGRIIPKTVPIPYPEGQLQKIQMLQEGILAYQDIFLKLREKKPVLGGIRKTGLLRPLQRLFSNPVKKEAQEFGNLSYDQNFGGNRFEKIINMDLVKILKNEGMKKFWSQLYTDDFQWYSGINAVNDGMFYFKQNFFMKTKLQLLRWVYLVEKVVERTQGERIILAGAGANLNIVLTLLSAIERQDIVEGITDNNEVLHDVLINGIKIHEVEYEFESAIYLITTTKKLFCEQLCRQIRKNRANAVIYTYFGDMDSVYDLN